MADQPEALRLADELDYKEQRFLDPYPSELRQAAAELRRLRAVNRELLEAAKMVIAWYEAEDDHSKADFYQRLQMCRDSETTCRAAIAKAEA